MKPLLVLALAAPVALAAAPGATDALFLTEVLANPAGPEAGHEAVELWNPGRLPLDLTGWTLGDDDLCRTPTGHYDYWFHPLTGEVPPGGRFAFTIPDLGGVPRCLSLTNDHDVVFLRDPAGRVVDAVCWAGDCPYHPEVTRAPVAADGESLHRCGDGAWRTGAPDVGHAGGCEPGAHM